MAKKGIAGKALDAAHHAMSIKNIIKAFLQGGWSAAALQALKHYWPQILAISIALTLIPVIIICCVPMIMFGYSGSTDSQINEISSQVKTVSECIENYYSYCEKRTQEIFVETKPYIDKGYKVVHDGYYLPKNWFIAIFSVSVGNNMIGVTEQQIINVVNASIVYRIESISITEEEQINSILVKRLSANEVMSALQFTEGEKDWATLIYNTLESERLNGNSSTYST